MRLTAIHNGQKRTISLMVGLSYYNDIVDSELGLNEVDPKEENEDLLISRESFVDDSFSFSKVGIEILGKLRLKFHIWPLCFIVSSRHQW